MCFYFYAVSLLSFSVLYTVSDERGVHGVVTNLIAPWSLQLALLVGACFVLGHLITRIDSAPLRFILALLPGLSFLMSPLRPVMLIHAAAWLYFVIVMTVGSFEVRLDQYRRRSGVMLAAALLLTICLIIFHFGTDDWYSHRLFGGEIYGLLFFVLCVLSLRGMRASLGAPRKMRLLDAAAVVTLPTLLLSVFFLLYAAVPAVTFLFSLLTRFLLWIGKTFFPGREMPDVFHPPEEENVNKKLKQESMQLPIGNDHSPEEGLAEGRAFRLQLSPRAELYIILVFLAAVLLFLAIRMIRRKDKSGGIAALAHEKIERPAFEGLRLRRNGESALPANVLRIRRIYRSYLQLLRSLRLRIDPSDTSADVLAGSSACVDVPENAALRELYIAARYGDPAAVTASQVGEAKRCLGVIEAAKHIAE